LSPQRRECKRIFSAFAEIHRNNTLFLYTLVVKKIYADCSDFEVLAARSEQEKLKRSNFLPDI
jgi:hypothetical protein